MDELDKIMLKYLKKSRAVTQTTFQEIRAEIAADLESNPEISDEDAQMLLECIDEGNAHAMDEINRCIAELTLESA